jgi:DNA-binding CsgD family transcriptional regulator
LNGLKSSLIKLTPQEHRVALSYRQFRNAKSISKDLGLSLSSVKFHLRNIREKMDQKKTVKAIWDLDSFGLLSE